MAEKTVPSVSQSETQVPTTREESRYLLLSVTIHLMKKILLASMLFRSMK